MICTLLARHASFRFAKLPSDFFFFFEPRACDGMSGVSDVASVLLSLLFELQIVFGAMRFPASKLLRPGAKQRIPIQVVTCLGEGVDVLE
jgi:hypothetical protein